MSDLDPGRVMAAVARAARVDVAAISRGARAQHRDGQVGSIPHPHTAVRIAAAWLLHHRCGLSYREVARRLRCHDYGAWKLVSWLWLRDDALAIAHAAEELLQRRPIDVEAALRSAREDAGGHGRRGPS